MRPIREDFPSPLAVPSPAPGPPAAPALFAESVNGKGVIQWERVGMRTVTRRLRADSPLKLLSPRSGSSSSWVIAGTYGGGLMAGDQIAIEASAGPRTVCFLGTQASTKIYRSAAGAVSRQALRMTIEEEAVCVVAPDPVTPFADARFEQRQRFDLASGASLVLVDWLTSGRLAAGERWSFAKYLSRIDVYQSGRLVLRDALSLDPADGPLDAPQRMGRCDCFGLVLVFGEPLRERAARLIEQVSAEPVRPVLSERSESNGPFRHAALAQDRPRASLQFSASPVAGGVLLRVAGPNAQSVGHWIRRRLDFVPPLLGADPWARKY